MNFSSIIRCDHKIFYIWRKSTKFTRFCYWSYHFSNICFSEIVVTPSKMVTDVSFYTNVLKRFNGKYFRGYRGFGFTVSQNFENTWNKKADFRQIFKIILINENPFLEMYPNEMNFLTYWFLRINQWPNQWKITKEQLSTEIDFRKVFRKTLCIVCLKKKCSHKRIL